jgi:hypothetical protein
MNPEPQKGEPNYWERRQEWLHAQWLAERKAARERLDAEAKAPKKFVPRWLRWRNR